MGLWVEELLCWSQAGDRSCGEGTLHCTCLWLCRESWDMCCPSLALCVSPAECRVLLRCLSGAVWQQRGAVWMCQPEQDPCHSPAPLGDTCTTAGDETETKHREQKVAAGRSGREEEESSRDMCRQFTFHTYSPLAQPWGRSSLWAGAGGSGGCGGLRWGFCSVTFPCSQVRTSPSCSLQLQDDHPAWKRFWMWPDSFVDQCHFCQWSYTRSK